MIVVTVVGQQITRLPELSLPDSSHFLALFYVENRIESSSDNASLVQRAKAKDTEATSTINSNINIVRRWGQCQKFVINK